MHDICNHFLNWHEELFDCGYVPGDAARSDLLRRIYELAGPELLELKRQKREINFASWIIEKSMIDQFNSRPFNEVYELYANEILSTGYYQPYMPGACFEQAMEAGLLNKEPVPDFDVWMDKHPGADLEQAYLEYKKRTRWHGSFSEALEMIDRSNNA